MTYGTHLRRSRHGTLYFRYVVPVDVRAELGMSELSISLGTSSKRGAELTALELQLVAKRCVGHAREAIRMNEPVKGNLTALHTLIRQRKFKVLQDDFHESESALADKTAQVEALTAKLISKLDLPRAEAGMIVCPTLSASVDGFKAERSATGAWTDKTAERWDIWFAEFSDISPKTDEGRMILIGMADFAEFEGRRIGNCPWSCVSTMRPSVSMSKRWASSR